MLHITLEAYHGGEHVTVFCDVPDAFAGITLDVGQVRAAIAVRSWGSPLLTGTVFAVVLVATANVPVDAVTSAAAGVVTVARCTRSVLTPEAEHRRGVRGTLDLGCTTIDSTEARAHDVSQARLGILMNAFSKSMDPEMWGEKSRIIFFAVQVHVRLEEGYCVGVIGELYRPKEDAASSSIGVVVVHLALESKEEEVRPGEVKHVIAVGPLGGVDGYDGVKTRHIKLENAPQIVLAVVGLASYRSQGRVQTSSQGARDEAGQEVHHGPAAIRKLLCPKARDEESLIAILQHN